MYFQIQIRTLVFCLFSLPGTMSFSQNVYYRLGTENWSEKEYFQKKSDLEKKHLVHDVIVRTIHQNDSTIHLLSRALLPGSHPHRNRIGQVFPIHEFRDLAGNKISKKYLKGKATVLNFWFVACRPCVAEIPYLNNLKIDFGEEVRFVAITFDKDKIVQSFLQKNSFNFDHITENGTALRKLEFNSYPYTYILDQNAVVINVYEGHIEKHLDEITDLLNRLK
jgi:cytochrome c biogenesis protein CcmG, thiol:disulfide interchange protein DsbE